MSNETNNDFMDRRMAILPIPATVIQITPPYLIF